MHSCLCSLQQQITFIQLYNTLKALVQSSSKLISRIHTYIQTYIYVCIPYKCSGSTFSPIPISPLLDSLLHLLTQQVHSSAELCPLCQTQSKSSRPWVFFKGSIAGMKDLRNCRKKAEQDDSKNLRHICRFSKSLPERKNYFKTDIKHVNLSVFHVVIG